MQMAQLIWFSGCPEKGHFSSKNAFLVFDFFLIHYVLHNFFKNFFKSGSNIEWHGWDSIYTTIYTIIRVSSKFLGVRNNLLHSVFGGDGHKYHNNI